MKLFVASDIHGSFTYCKKMIDKFNKDKYDYLVLLGDILYHGPRNDLSLDYDPKKVSDLLNLYKDKILCVRGNCDAEVDQMMLDFSIEEKNILIVNNDKKIFLTHGHIYNENNLPPLRDIDYLFCGHTHRKLLKEVDGVTVVNPGSISLPKDGTNSYFVMDDDKILFYEL
ncbi:MAG: phosphodiesterase [Acholeplasmatales bacterium]|nr:phosphodiesterase [Acholeplasmatales bacterium]